MTDAPLPAHVQQEDVESRLLLLHQLEDALHAQTVGRPVRARRVYRHHEAVAVVLVSVTGVVQQTWRGTGCISKHTFKKKKKKTKHNPRVLIVDRPRRPGNRRPRPRVP